MRSFGCRRCGSASKLRRVRTTRRNCSVVSKLKRRDGAVDHVILLLADTRHNRRFVRALGAGFRSDFPLPAETAVARLEVGRDPGESSIVLL